MKPLQDSDPRSIGPYQSLGVLGEGGMGRVYLGVDEDGHQAAVKVVYADLVRDEDFRKRFTREASATAAVSGRFIARIVASDLEATPPWLATEYIDGPSLHDVVAKQGGALAPSRAQEIAASLAEALDTIHAAGVVHRDVKPANILLGPDGAYLIDFGIAREAAASTITRTGTVVGTPPFMAPEQIRGHRTLGPPADIFALGGVLAFASTGRHPFGEGDNTSLAYRIVHEAPDLDGVEDEIVKALIMACLAKKPEDRPTADQVRARLGAVATRMLGAPAEHGAASEATVALDGAEPQTPAETPTESLPPTGQRRRRWTMVALATGHQCRNTRGGPGRRQRAERFRQGGARRRQVPRRGDGFFGQFFVQFAGTRRHESRSAGQHAGIPPGRPAADGQRRDRLGDHQHPGFGTRTRARHHDLHLTVGAEPHDDELFGPEATAFPADQQIRSPAAAEQQPAPRKRTPGTDRRDRHGRDAERLHRLRGDRRLAAGERCDQLRHPLHEQRHVDRRHDHGHHLPHRRHQLPGERLAGLPDGILLLRPRGERLRGLGLGLGQSALRLKPHRPSTRPPAQG